MDNYDVVIMGGGLAGLSLGVQLKQARPETSIVILEQRRGPAPEAAHKVGESTVELAAHYYAEVIGMKEHLKRNELRKAGLRFYFPAGDNSDITRRVEWGGTMIGPVPSFQLDRGRFENALADRNRELGNEIRDGRRIRDFQIDPAERHTVLVDAGDQQESVNGRWLVDASSYRRLIARKLGLGRKVAHRINAAWFRLADMIDHETWSDDPAWLGRMSATGIRQLSTNHLMGEGYWVWLIPLSSGSISVGIVADPRHHAFDQFNTFERSLAWLYRHEPQLAAQVEKRRGSLQDFLKLSHFSHGCARVFSSDRWAITGVAGPFLDPFYSPGSDFIAMGNTMITDLIARNLDGEDVAERTDRYDRRFMDLFDQSMDGTYVDHYPGMGNTGMMSAKLVWDFAYFFAMIALPFMQHRFLDEEFLDSVKDDRQRMIAVHYRVNQICRDWHARVAAAEWKDQFLTPMAFPALLQLYLDLHGSFDSEALRRRYAANADLLEAMAVVIFHSAMESVSTVSIPPDVPLDPGALDLNQEKWEANGLFRNGRLSLNQARMRAAGIEKVLLLPVTRTTGEESKPDVRFTAEPLAHT